MICYHTIVLVSLNSLAVRGTNFPNTLRNLILDAPMRESPADPKPSKSCKILVIRGIQGIEKSWPDEESRMGASRIRLPKRRGSVRKILSRSGKQAQARNFTRWTPVTPPTSPASAKPCVLPYAPRAHRLTHRAKPALATGFPAVPGRRTPNQPPN